MRKVLQVVTVGASALAALASASSNRKPYNDPYTGTYMQVPPLERHQVVHGDPVGGVEIAATPYGAVGWQLVVKNTTSAMVSAHWDESTFVTSNGASAGRLIRGETRKMDVGNAQPATPIAPGSSIIQIVFPEQGIGSEDDEADAMKQGYQPRVYVEPVLERRRNEAKLVIGGKLVVTLDVGGQRLTWTGVVESTNAPQGSAAQNTLEKP